MTSASGRRTRVLDNQQRRSGPHAAHALLELLGGPMKTRDSRSGRPDPLRAHFLFDCEGKSFAYCRIRKNGCSAFQKFIIETSPHRRRGAGGGMVFLRRFHGVNRKRAIEAADHRILVFRDPVERIRSLFVNKFVQRKDCDDIFRSYRAVTGRDPLEASLRDFILRYVSRLGETPLDPHVWPQHWHLSHIIYDRVFPLGELHDGMVETIGQDLANKFFQRKVNSSPLSDVTIDKDLLERISYIYKEDLKMICRVT